MVGMPEKEPLYMLIIITVTLYKTEGSVLLSQPPLSEFHHHTSTPSAQPPRKMQGSPRVCAGPGAVLGQGAPRRGHRVQSPLEPCAGTAPDPALAIPATSPPPSPVSRPAEQCWGVSGPLRPPATWFGARSAPHGRA